MAESNVTKYVTLDSLQHFYHLLRNGEFKASQTHYGGIRLGTALAWSGDDNSTDSTVGVVVGEGLNDANGVLTLDLPVATENTLGGIKVGENLSISEDGTLSAEEGVSIESITYSELKSLRDSSQLVPGRKYRITDYTCSGNGQSMSVMNHPFDIIVEALTENKLSENAKATQPSNDIGTLINSNLINFTDINGWKSLNISSDTPQPILNIAAISTDGKVAHDRAKYSGLNPGTVIKVSFTGFVGDYNNVSVQKPITGLGVVLADQDDTEILAYDYGYNKEAYYITMPDSITSNTSYYIKFYADGSNVEANNGICGVKGEVYSGTPYFKNNDLNKWDLKYSLDRDGFNWLPSLNNNVFKGVIYYMKDDFNNEAPYDFKNILFPVTINGSSKYYYTFSYVNNGSVYDATVVTDKCFENTIKGTYNIDGVQGLNKIVFINKDFGSNTNCSFNSFGGYCNNIVFGHACCSNTFGCYCANNSFGDYCSFNTFGNHFGGLNGGGNTFGNYCQSNTFDVNCDNNTFGNYTFNNTFGKKCQNCKFTNAASNGSLLEACKRITIGAECNNLNLYNTEGPSYSGSKFLQNIEVNPGLTGNIKISGLNKGYKQVVAKDSNGQIVVYIDGESSYELPPATTETLGGIKVGANLSISEDGTLSAKASAEEGASIESITYSELVLLRNNNQLVPGASYRITDYVTTTTQDATQSAGHPFNVIVTALTNNTISEEAKACLHEEDTYFSNNDLNAWEIKYCLDNDTSRFAWADEENGKGVIYYMEDEYKNKCWYDFKNIQFLRTSDFFNTNSFLAHLEGDNYYYTFTKIYDNTILDNTVNNPSNSYSINNHIGVRGQTQRKLTDIIFINSTGVTRNNIIGDSSYSCTFGNGCHDNIIADYCYNNIIGNEFKNNNIKQLFTNNKVTGTFQYNTLGIQCYNNNFSGYIWFTTFGSQFNYCSFNIPEGSKLEYCEFGSGIGFLNGIPAIRKVTFENNVAWYDTTTYVTNLETVDGRTLAEAITTEHDEQLYVYKVGDKYGVTSFSEMQNPTQQLLVSNPGTPDDNANGYGYVGTLQNLGVSGDIILVDTLSFYVRTDHISKGTNIDTPIWCRLYKFVNNDWELVYQSSTSIKQRNYSSGDLFSFKMESKSNDTIKSSDKIAIIYSNSDDIDVFSSINLGTKAILNKTGGLNNELVNSSTGANNYQPAIIVSYLSMASTPINAVTLENNQTITGLKQFNNGVSINGESFIDFDIDPGELKVFPQGSNRTDTNKGFIIRSTNRGETIPTVEILATNKSQFYSYNFPKKGGTVALLDDVNSKQNTLVSGTNIKTINNQSILGSGNITIQSGSSYKLPEASDQTLGGIRLGTALKWSDQDQVGVVVGEGLSDTNAGGGIKLTAASANLLGGIKVKSSNTTVSNNSIGIGSGTHYGVKLNSNGLAYVSVPPSSLSVDDIPLGTALATNNDGELFVNIGDGLETTSNKSTLILGQASASDLGGIRLGTALKWDGTGSNSAVGVVVGVGLNDTDGAIKLAAATKTSLGGGKVNGSFSCKTDTLNERQNVTIPVQIDANGNFYISFKLGTNVIIEG